jgi:hypothetical protein
VTQLSGGPPKRIALSDEQWRRVAALLGADDSKWRLRINTILNFCNYLTWIRGRNAAQNRDVYRLMRAAELARKLARLLSHIEVEKLDVVSNAVKLCVSQLKSYATPARGHKKRGKHFEERDFCINLLISYVWKKARTGLIVEPEKIGDKSGPLAKFLIEAYRPISSLTPHAVIEIARLPRRRPDRYGRDRWNWGRMDLRHFRELFDKHVREADELSECQAREIDELD